MTDYECIYNAAIVLNNTAIHLVQHAMYFEASATLQDAMKCTKFFCNGGTSVDESLLMQRFDCDRALKAARDRKNDIKTDGCTEISSLYRNYILVVSDQDDPQEVCYTLEQNRSLRCCVTIDPVEKFDVNDVDRLQVESALIVYNFGVVYRCIASSPVIVRSTTKDIGTVSTISHLDVFCASIRILELARCVTTNLLSVLSCNGTRSLHISSNLLLAAVLVLTNLHQMSVESLSLQETQQYYSMQLGNVLEMISARELFLISEGYEITVALAA
jgi:hypothetical protein